MLKRYGRDAYRIFRLLMKTGRLHETDKVSRVLGFTLFASFMCLVLYTETSKSLVATTSSVDVIGHSHVEGIVLPN